MATVSDSGALPALQCVDRLEEQLKTVQLALGKLLDWHARVSAANLNAYAPNAPAAITRVLKEAVTGYEATCDALEMELLRAQAVLERDDKRARGELLPVKQAITIDTGTPQASGDPVPTSSADDLMKDLFGDTPIDLSPSTSTMPTTGFFLPTASSSLTTQATSVAPSPKPPELDLASLGLDVDLTGLIGSGASPFSLPSQSSSAPSLIDPLMDLDLDELLKGS